MTTANPESRQARSPADGSITGPTARSPARHPGWYATLRDALDRPLTSYYLLLAASALLLTIGVIMVLSASSVYSFKENDGDSYAVVKRQLMWVAHRAALRVDREPAVPALDPARSPGPGTSSRWCCSC